MIAPAATRRVTSNRRPPTAGDGSHTELILVEGHSQDQTLEECRRIAASEPTQDITVLVQRVGAKAMPYAWDCRRPAGTSS